MALITSSTASTHPSIPGASGYLTVPKPALTDASPLERGEGRGRSRAELKVRIRLEFWG